MKPERYIFDLMRNGTFKYWDELRNTYIYDDVSQMNAYCIEHSTRPGAYIFHELFSELFKFQLLLPTAY